jgi:hypothetical protein
MTSCPNARKRGQGGNTLNIDTSSSSPSHNVDLVLASVALFCNVNIASKALGNADLRRWVGDEHPA